MTELITRDYVTDLDQDPQAIVTALWTDPVESIQSYYAAERGWQIVAIAARQRPELADRYDREFYNVIFDCDEQNNVVYIVVK
tara:strand:- start:391 stop:639 length:249 start_codon:yes stop_codon:yes gene_type:complete